MYEMEVLLMADTVENLALVMSNLSHSIEELKATIASLNSTIDSLKAENECEPKLLEDISYTRTKKKQKGKIDIKLDNLKHVKKVYDIDEKDRVCDECGSKLSYVGEEFVRHEVIYEPAKLYVKDIYRKTYECRNCRKKGKAVMLKAGTPQPVVPHSYTSPSVLSQVIIDKYVNHMPLYRQES